MSDPFLSSSLEPSSSQSSAKLSSQSSVQSLFESVFYEVTDSSFFPFRLIFSLGQPQLHSSRLSSSCPCPPQPYSRIWPSRYFDRKSSESFAAIPQCHTQRAETGYLPASWRHSCVQDSQPGEYCSSNRCQRVSVNLANSVDSVGMGTATATEEPRLLNSSTFFHITGEWALSNLILIIILFSLPVKSPIQRHSNFSWSRMCGRILKIWKMWTWCWTKSCGPKWNLSRTRDSSLWLSVRNPTERSWKCNLLYSLCIFFLLRYFFEKQIKYKV